ncbi:isocitrate lyase/PEP mutase family protein [Prauserella muralis]|uniref:Phosphonomutase n=1 Tax=Prauserella muralis TaxID=588067 RepID=A0A2V4B6N0_9PSEU|nr:isocitrate lyase/phosphoenolpyruvate mutase family protein [Prauserella muralis]PXY30964.1 phosphonomutase [Prauserella muralis]TWE14776.1 2-methylisocitrate lyase-like PEP mutase family enzyme [Prauserella muralis]
MNAFHDLHHAATPLVLPNAWDHASGAALAAAGFAAIGTTSLGVAAAHGLADGEGRTREPTIALARSLASLPCLLTVDLEAGFSDDPAEVAGLAATVAEAGAAGINLEDGRDNRALADPGRQSELIAAVKQRAPELFVNARTDTYWLGIDARPGPTLARLERYVAAGADGVFVPGVLSPGDLRAVAAGVPAPLNVLAVPGLPPLADLAALGVRRVSTGSLLFRAALHAAVEVAEAVRDGGQLPREVPGYAEIQRLSASPGS